MRDEARTGPAAGAAAGPNDEDALILAPGSAKLDWEVELAVVIGTPAWRVREEDALRHVAGYCLCNDVSERASQIEYEGQWTKGASEHVQLSVSSSRLARLDWSSVQTQPNEGTT